MKDDELIAMFEKVSAQLREGLVDLRDELTAVDTRLQTQLTAVDQKVAAFQPQANPGAPQGAGGQPVPPPAQAPAGEKPAEPVVDKVATKTPGIGPEYAFAAAQSALLAWGSPELRLWAFLPAVLSAMDKRHERVPLLNRVAVPGLIGAVPLVGPRLLK